jgi:translation initiation factor IF-1
VKEAAAVETTGVVVSEERGGNFKVCVDGSDQVVKARCNGHLNKHKINIRKGDEVRIEISPYDIERARIVYRVSGKRA